jgi:Rod binding domain-containing protein
MSVDFNPSLAGINGEASPAGKSSRAERSPEEQAKMREAAVRFEELMLRQLFVQMQRSSAVDGEKPMATEFYGDMFAEKMAETASGRGGIGIAEVLMRSWGVEPDAAAPVGDDTEWSPQDLEEFARYRAPIEGDVQLRGSQRGLEVAATDPSVEVAAVAPRGGRLRLDGEHARIEHPGGWTTRFEGVRLSADFDGAWVDPGTELGRGRGIRAIVERPAGHTV